MPENPKVFTDHDHASCISAALKNAQKMCADRQAQLTPVRRRTLEILLEHHTAMGAYDVLARLDADGFGAKPPVAYRALAFLVEQGFAHRLEHLNAFVACANPGAAHDPAFMICRACKKVAEVVTDDSPITPAAQSGFQIEKAMIEVEGLCPACQDAT